MTTMAGYNKGRERAVNDESSGKKGKGGKCNGE